MSNCPAHDLNPIPSFQPYFLPQLFLKLGSADNGQKPKLPFLQPKIQRPRSLCLQNLRILVGNLIETIKIGALAGWDSDNPTATWGGLIGLMLGKEGVEKEFGQKFSNKFHIHRTRQGFPGEGIDTFENMTQKGLWIIDRVVQEELKGGVDLNTNSWYIPKK